MVSGFTRDRKKKETRSSLEDNPSHRRTNISMVQNVLLIWLDSNFDQENEDCRNTIMQLKRVVNAVNTFSDNEQCVTFLSDNKEDKVCMIISGSLGQHIVPTVHDMSQVDSIFIFCGNTEHHEIWAKEWPKIKGVFTEIIPICEALKQAAQECEHNAVGISFMPKTKEVSNEINPIYEALRQVAHECEHNAVSISFMSTHVTNASKINMNHLDCSFMYTQILKEILLTIEFDEKHIKEFIEFCCGVFVDNADELSNIKQLERKYNDNTPIWWYTYECFLYPMLNRALRTMDMDNTIKMGFFVRDLHRHIQQLHSKQFSGPQSEQVFTVYRGQGLRTTDFEQMMDTKGGLIAFNSFLSTSKDCKVSLDFARRAVTNPDLVGILFVMTINSSQSSTPFASINDVSYFQKQEEEVLFSMHTVFRIHEIKQMDGSNRLWQVELSLTSENDQQLQALTKSMREETEGSSGWFRLGRLLIRAGQMDQAHRMYELLLKEASDESDKANIFHQLGLVNFNQGKYEEALSFYKNSLGIRQKTLPAYHLDLAKTYNNIGNVYSSTVQYSKALSSYEKALKIRQKSLPPNHPDVAMCYNNIGNVYYSMRKYSKALSSHKKALEIRQKSLPTYHPDLSLSYNNIGNIYHSKGKRSKALSSHEKALEIRQKSLPPHHPDLALSCYNIGLVYETMGEHWQAHSIYERAVGIGQTSLPANHPHLQLYRNNLDLVKKKL